MHVLDNPQQLYWAWTYRQWLTFSPDWSVHYSDVKETQDQQKSSRELSWAFSTGVFLLFFLFCFFFANTLLVINNGPLCVKNH